MMTAAKQDAIERQFGIEMHTTAILFEVFNKPVSYHFFSKLSTVWKQP